MSEKGRDSGGAKAVQIFASVAMVVAVIGVAGSGFHSGWSIFWVLLGFAGFIAFIIGRFME